MRRTSRPSVLATACLATASLALSLSCQPQAAEPASASSGSEQASAPTPAPAPPPAPQGPPPAIGTFGIDLAGRDLSVPAGKDFFGHANGSWYGGYELKPDEMRYGTMIELHYRSEDQVKAIIDELGTQPQAPGSPEQQLTDYFKSYMDLARLNELGISPLKPALDEVAGIRSRKQLVAALGKAGHMESASPIQAGVAIDRKNPDRHMLVLDYGGLGMPDRSYYLDEPFADARKAYEQNVATLLTLAGTPKAQAGKHAAAILKLETEIAKAHWPRAEKRDADKTYNPYTLSKLEAEVRAFAWRPFLQAAGVDDRTIETLNVAAPSAMAPLAGLVAKTPLPTWRAYLRYHLVKNHAHLLGDEIDNAMFAFYGKVLGGQQEQRERWKRSLGLIGSVHGLGDIVGKLYVAKHFPPEAKAAMDALVANLRTALGERIKSLSWMGEATKKEAMAKLATFNPKVGYPTKWHDLSSITIKPDDLMANYHAVREFWYQDELARLGRPTDKNEWFMTPHTVNAYYNPQFNEIVFPAAILQPPFFDPHADPAVNYGAIGGVIGHEMGHGFDDQGSKYDAAGVQRNWWTEEDRAHFEEQTAQLVAQYSTFEPIPGHSVNGKLTLGENIGDLGGVEIALHAYRLSLAGEQPPVLEGLTGDQRFFLSWAQVWRAKARDQFVVMRLKSDPHSPEKARVNGPLRNVNAWYAAFDIKPEAPLYLPPDKRVSIW